MGWDGWERSLAASKASSQLPAMVQGLPHVRDLCTIQGVAALYRSRFPFCSSLLSLFSAQTTQSTCFTHTSALFVSQSPGRETGVIQRPSQHRPVLQAEPSPPSIQCIAARCQQWVEPVPDLPFSHLPFPIAVWDLPLGPKGWMRTLPVAARMVGHSCVAKHDRSTASHGTALL